MTFASTERAQVDSFVAVVRAIPSSGTTNIPVDAECAVFGRDESEPHTAFFPGCLAVKEFNVSWGVNMKEDVVAFLCANEAVGVRGGRPPTACWKGLCAVGT